MLFVFEHCRIFFMRNGELPGLSLLTVRPGLAGAVLICLLSIVQTSQRMDLTIRIRWKVFGQAFEIEWRTDQGLTVAFLYLAILETVLCAGPFQ